MIALLLTQTLASTPAEPHKHYEKCIVEETAFYAAFCYPLSDVVMAVRGVCRPTVEGTLDKKVMQFDAHSKSEVIRQYMTTMDEVIYRVAMDARIQKKVDCGQFNDVSPKDIVDKMKKHNAWHRVQAVP